MKRTLGDLSNDCESCDHFKNKNDGHCYMFKTEPKPICTKHSKYAHMQNENGVVTMKAAFVEVQIGKDLYIKAKASAMDFLKALPPEIPKPLIDVEIDGNPSFEWVFPDKADWRIEAKIDMQFGKLIFSGQCGNNGPTLSGWDYYKNGVPSELLSLVKKVLRGPEEDGGSDVRK